MKIILAITVCNQNKNRIDAQIKNIQSWKLPDNLEIVPVFIFGKGGDPTGIPFDTVEVDVPEQYNLLYLKLFEAYRHINKYYDYDFICKIDDDTKLNIERLKIEKLEGRDYVGRIFVGDFESSILLNLEFCNIHKRIHLKPPLFREGGFWYCTGDCYFLSKKAVGYILESEDLLPKPNEGYRVNEDKLFGYILDKKTTNVNDLKNLDGFARAFAEENELQITYDYLSIHPINENILPMLVGLPLEEQLKLIHKNKSLNLLRRKAYIQELEDKIKNTVIEFLNSKRSIGLG